MAIVRGPKPEKEFLMVANSLLRDGRISYRALGILLETLSRPKNWSPDAVQMSQPEGREGRDAVRTAMRELEAVGYLHRWKRQGADGKWETAVIVHDYPCASATCPGKVAAGKPTSVNQASVSPGETLQKPSLNRRLKRRRR